MRRRRSEPFRETGGARILRASFRILRKVFPQLGGARILRASFRILRKDSSCPERASAT
jgi:hypothetical protein